MLNDLLYVLKICVLITLICQIHLIIRYTVLPADASIVQYESNVKNIYEREKRT
jgi:hypothetical protein